MAKLNIVLYEPEIPYNTGNIGRTCVATGTRPVSYTHLDVYKRQLILFCMFIHIRAF